MIAEAIMDIIYGPNHTSMKTNAARKLYNDLIEKHKSRIKKKNWHTGRIVFAMDSNGSRDAFFWAGDRQIRVLVMANVVQIIG